MRLAVVAGLLMIVGCGGVQPIGTEVGNLAPEIEGTDVLNQRYRLSEFRGKVVVLNFWATWCGPCRQMIPHEKALARRMAGRPFTFLAVTADDDPVLFRRFLDDEGIDWPNLFDGPNGPIITAWNVKFYPTIYVIDASGVIRHKNLRGSELDNAVEELVKEAERK